MSEDDGDTLEDNDDERDEFENATEVECPYCGSGLKCEHYLIDVDLCFHEAGIGPLSERFEETFIPYFNAMEEREGDEFEEREALDEYLWVITLVADAEVDVDFDGAPGMSTTYRYYYCSSAARVARAVARFKPPTVPDGD